MKLGEFLRMNEDGGHALIQVRFEGCDTDLEFVSGCWPVIDALSDYWDVTGWSAKETDCDMLIYVTKKPF